MYYLMHSEIQINKIICSDINNDLISLFNEIKNSPYQLISEYNKMWHELNKNNNIDRKKEYYNYVRNKFNKFKNPCDFLFLSRTCTNGLIRYNLKGEFNASLHFSRSGIKPDKLEKIIIEWSQCLNKNNVKFICADYSEINAKNKNDFMYLDPPYYNTKGMYYGIINYEKFWTWLKSQPCQYLLSFGKRKNKNNTYNVPTYLYSKHVYLPKKRSSFKDLRCQITEYVEESLYIS